MKEEMNYKLAYTIGFHPWEDAEEQEPFVEKITELISHEENRRELPYGPALDLGTGSGIWGVWLAKRGWQVTGVDIVEKALHRAHVRVEESEVDMKIVQGDVTNLGAAEIESDFQLILDTGTFHGLTDKQRKSMGQEIDAIASADATVLLLVWTPKHRGPLPRGASRNEIEAAFPGWIVTDLGPSGFSAPKLVEMLMNPVEHWYRLRRK